MLLELLRLLPRWQRRAAHGKERQYVRLALLRLLLLAAHFPQRARQAQLDLLRGVLHGRRWWWCGYP